MKPKNSLVAQVDFDGTVLWFVMGALRGEVNVVCISLERNFSNAASL